MGEDSSSPIDIFALLGSQTDLTIVYYPMRDVISGMSVKDDQFKLIAINSKLTKGRQRFTAAHELCHLYFHNQFKSVVCSRDLVGMRSESEKEADQFASFFLAPYEALLNFIKIDLDKKGKRMTVDDIVRIEQHFGMSRQATLVRLQSEGLITEDESNLMKTNAIRSAQKLGFSADLYQPNTENKQYMTVGSYVKMANDLYSLGKISLGKYEELLLDAFRDDIVYGTDAVGEHDD
jgi:Zn-dependent peptidase ImmA (M78 family)